MASAITETSARSAIAHKQLLLQIAGGYELSACLYVAANLNIADRLAAGPPASTKELAHLVGVGSPFNER